MSLVLMPFVITPWMVAATVVALVVGLTTGRWMALVSRRAARALRLGALGLGVSIVCGAFQPFVADRPGVGEAFFAVSCLALASFWAAFAFAAWAVAARGAPEEGR